MSHLGLPVILSGTGAGSKQKAESSGWFGVFGGEEGRASAWEWEGLFLTKQEDNEAKRSGDAGGAEGSVGDGGLGSTTA